MNANTYDISSIKSVTRKFLEVSRCSRAKQRQRNVQKKCAARAKLFFFLIRPIVVFHRSPALPSPLSITRFYIFFEQTITNIIESSASYISVVHCCCSFYFGDYDDNSMAPIWRDATGLCIGTVYFLLQSAL